jgi:hypothetical protein
MGNWNWLEAARDRFEFDKKMRTAIMILFWRLGSWRHIKDNIWVIIANFWLRDWFITNWF